MLNELLLGNPVRPTWKHDFLSGVLPSGATFSRASSGTYFSSSGVLATASSNVARFDYDPLTLAPLGYRSEMPSTNSCLNSGDLSLWGEILNVAVSTDGTLAPDGTSNMAKITSSAGAGYHGVQQTGGMAVTTGQIYDVSIFVKQGTERYCTIGDGQAASWHVVTFDFQTGTFSGQTNAVGSARQVASDKWRLSARVTSSSNHNAAVLVSFGPVANGGYEQNYNAAGTETGYAWGGQIDSLGAGVTSYIPTAGATVTRSQDVLTLPLSAMGFDATRGGVLVATYRLHTLVPSSPGYNQSLIYLSDGSLDNSVHMQAQYGGTGTMGWSLYSGGSGIGNQTGATSAAFVRRRQAVSWQAGRIVNAANGFLTNPADTGAVALPIAMTTAAFGRYSGHGLNGTLENVAYYRGARPDAFVQDRSR